MFRYCRVRLLNLAVLVKIMFRFTLRFTLRILALVWLLTMGSYAMAEEERAEEARALEEDRTITVSGTGYAEVAPNRAVVRMSIVARDPALAAAQKQAAEVTNQVLKMTDRLDIPRDQVDTTGASVRADYRWNRDKEEQELRGYIAERQIAVAIKDLDKLGALVEGAVRAGVNQVSPPQLDSSRRQDTYRQALSAAAADAKANAAVLAETLGARLGQVLSINSSVNPPQPPQPLLNVRAMSADAGAVESYNAADLSFNADVSVVFELID